MFLGFNYNTSNVFALTTIEQHVLLPHTLVSVQTGAGPGYGITFAPSKYSKVSGKMQFA